MPFVIYMSQDPVLSMEPGMLVCPKYGKRRLFCSQLSSVDCKVIA